MGRLQTRVIKRDPDCEVETESVEFRLSYEGCLLGASRENKRPKHKHEIRRVFHKQLKRLFGVHPAFALVQPCSPNDPGFVDFNTVIRLNASHRKYMTRIENFERCGYRFFPLATREMALLCSVHILFLRPDTPGGVIRSGDIDNRMKTIFDALKMPGGKDELGGYDTPSGDEDPFFCLLEDDSLISHAAIETDTLLQPTGDDWEANDVRLILTISLRPYRVTWENIAFG